MADDTQIKIEILLKALEHTQTNNRHFIDRSQSIVSWIGSLLLAIIGGLALLGPAKLSAYGSYLRVGLTVAIFSLFIFAWITEIRLFYARIEEGKAAVKIARLLHFFNAGYFDDQTVIFDENDWSKWMHERLRRWGVSSGTSVLFVLTTIVGVLIWYS